ncbi:zf-CSL-domain-containing protein [Annulohypoxylon truncatum]|uniref:zf-CSL-domain-containing protein n=1 Tax=Annulohypoxylon truncatum TaxID=327061 RepID=UPI00200757EB|nr:zf-CSL-domain-containing protein [Annulohypoxylon truncatum]KAI1210749.1 zf-CSL-domain-containing protein [Annulohypoxylon truncatum]
MANDEEIAVYDEVEIEDMTYDETLQIYHYPCPCGDRFEIALMDLQDEATDIADNLPKPDSDPSAPGPVENQVTIVA